MALEGTQHFEPTFQRLDEEAVLVFHHALFNRCAIFQIAERLRCRHFADLSRRMRIYASR